MSPRPDRGSAAALQDVAATTDNVAIQWDNALLQAIRVTKPGPPIVARALAIVHTTMYDAWAAYDDQAVGTRLGGSLRRPRALELSASYVTAHQWFAEYLAALGRHDEALVEIKRAQQLDPLSVPVNRAVGWVLYFARRYDQAIEEFQKTLAMDPDFLGARLVLWWAYVAKGAYDEAIADIRKQMERPGSKTLYRLMLGYACAASGKREEARRILEELEPKLAGADRLALLSTFLFTALDAKDRAFEQLERAYQLRDPGLPFLRVAPWLDPLRSDPRYGALVTKLGLG